MRLMARSVAPASEDGQDADASALPHDCGGQADRLGVGHDDRLEIRGVAQVHGYADEGAGRVVENPRFGGELAQIDGTSARPRAVSAHHAVQRAGADLVVNAARRLARSVKLGLVDDRQVDVACQQGGDAAGGFPSRSA
jgi:hypothetical protein